MNLSKKKIIAFISAIIIIIAAILLLRYFWNVNQYQSTVDQMSFTDIEIENIPDGIYEGECNVDFISAKVKVTVSDGRITDIDLIEHHNERGTPAEKIIDDIIQEQRTDVDVISGATNSSKVIKKAIENALLRT